MLKNNSKLLLGIMVGLIIGTVITCSAAIQIASNSINYDNSNSGLKINNVDVDNVQDAIDALHADISSRSPVSTCKNGYTQGVDYGAYYECLVQTYAITPGYTCVRAKWLHKEICTQSSLNCSGDGYYLGGAMNTSTVTYGKLGTNGENIEVGDAFDCDVNGNGYIDVDEKGYSTERFYYVSPRWTPGTDVSSTAFDANIAVLIYYSNTYNGLISNNSAAYATKADIQSAFPGETISNYDNWHGPVTAIKHLPKTTTNGGTWGDFIVKDNNNKSNRAIMACGYDDCDIPSTSTTGGSTPQYFSYDGYAGRLLTVPELKYAGCNTLSGKTSLSTSGALKACNFLLENTKYTNSNLTSWGPWLENPSTSNYYYAWNLNSTGRDIYTNIPVNNTGSVGTRPVIEVPVSQILK